MSLEIKKINKKYGDQVALIDVSFSLKKGDIVGFLGPNGAGKTTLMKIITSILKPDSGNITINGYDTQKNEISTKKQIGYLAENNPLYKDMLVTEYLDFIASLYEIENKKDKVKEIIKKTGLEGEIKKKIEELSKGYKQRVGIAAALVHDPNVLILDEPTTGLDPQARHSVWDQIRIYKNDGKTVLLTTHYMDEAEILCDEIAIMDAGKILIRGTPKELITKTVGTSAVEFVSLSFEKGKQILNVIEDKGKEMEVKLNRITDRIIAYGKDVETLTTEFENDSNLTDIIRRRTTLEDVFLNLTGRQLRE